MLLLAFSLVWIQSSAGMGGQNCLSSHVVEQAGNKTEIVYCQSGGKLLQFSWVHAPLGETEDQVHRPQPLGTPFVEMQGDALF